MKTLKRCCIEKVVDAFGIETDISTTDQLDYLISTFQKLRPYLSVTLFKKLLKNKNATFQSFIWFLHNFVWNSNEVYFTMTDYNASIMTNWMKEKCFSEVSFIGYDYFGTKMMLSFKHNQGPNLIEAEVAKINQMFKRQPKLQPVKTELNNCPRSLRLTIFNCYFLFVLDEILPLFFDLDDATFFHYPKMMKVLGFPGFECGKEMYKMFNLLYVTPFIPVRNYIDLGNSKDDTVYIVRAVEKTSENQKSKVAHTNLAKTKASSKMFSNSLKSYPYLRSAEINLMDVPDEQKKAVIKSLNDNLLQLKLTFFQPINFFVVRWEKVETLADATRWLHWQQSDCAPRHGE